ncbi:aminopeptidase P family protein [bacterium]|nr:aminopeptidase P family protein [candidate division CSSED10-310 bacterium]
MLRRRLAVRQLLDHTGCDGIVITDASVIRYLTGLMGAGVCALLHARGGELFADYTRYRAMRRATGWNVHCTGGQPWISAITWVLEEDIRRVGYDSWKTPAGLIEYSKKRCVGRVEWFDVGGPISELRRIKDRKEIDSLRQAAMATEMVLDSSIPLLRDGITENEWAVHIHAKLMETTGELPAFFTMVAFGENTVHPHWENSNRRLSPGDTVIVDCGATVNGYCADITRTFFWKRASARQLRRLKIIVDVLEAAIAHIRTGTVCSEIDAIVRSELALVVLDRYYLHPLGHGVGLDLHENPVFSVDSEDQIMVDMAFALEPGVFIPGWGGIRIEEMIWYSSQGPIVLSQGRNKNWSVVQ